MTNSLATTLNVRLYSAFAAAKFGGNVAGVVYDPAGLSADDMQRLAADLGAPTTGFVRDLGADGFGVRFFSAAGEMAMCGHVTVGVFAALADDGLVGVGTYRQVTAAGELTVTVEKAPNGFHVKMRQPAPRFDLFDLPADRVAPLLGLACDEVESIGSAATGLRHLFAEVAGTDALARLRPDDQALRALCQQVGIDTVGVFTRLHRGREGAHVRLRDLCHGVGDPEEAASGTTNGALAALLWRRRQLAHPGDGGTVVVRAEQGIEMGRPSLIVSELRVSGEELDSVRVGGSATCRLAGRLFLS